MKTTNYNKILDDLLMRSFNEKEGGILWNNEDDDFLRILEEQKYLYIDTQNKYNLTLEGKILLSNGGFVGKIKREQTKIKLQKGFWITNMISLLLSIIIYLTATYKTYIIFDKLDQKVEESNKEIEIIKTKLRMFSKEKKE